jgi:hypothetical protein
MIAHDEHLVFNGKWPKFCVEMVASYFFKTKDEIES